MPNEIIKTFKSWPTFKERFISNIPKDCFFPENEDICWEWQGAKTDKGYGQLDWRKNYHYKAQRVSYLIFNGFLTKDQVVRHTCDNPGCVNPKHLILESVSNNAIDMIKGENYGF